eukprot:TRINITY_DN3518_c0_g1_i5.p1 TRINITY_DN3518_c0_g1~~TRINITY_DN3518_c0_g1_i5.p1  ORF type:complete len:1387 (+),score=232.49 TRINITY_DN3518_c0_g1_i5:237-4397(+)
MLPQFLVFLLSLSLIEAIVLPTQSTSSSTSYFSMGEYQSISVSSELPSGIYFAPECTGTEELVFGSCGEESCVTPGKTEVASTSSSITYVGKIANPLECRSLVISLHVSYGCTKATVTVGNFVHVLLNPSKPTEGIVPLSMCCSELSDNAGPLWDGSFEITLESAFGDLEATLLVPQDTSKLSITDYYEAIPVTVECNGVDVTPTNGVPINVQPTYDPLFSFWTKTTSNLIGNLNISSLPEEENTLSTIIWITQILPQHRVGSLDWGIGNNVLSTTSFFSDSCKIVYHSLVNSNGQAITVETGKAAPVSFHCSSDEYVIYYSDFQKIISYLGNSELASRDTSTTIAFVDLAYSYPNSLVWASCKEQALSFLGESPRLITEKTTDCLKPPGTLEWLYDPCCNSVLLNTTCCATQDYPITFLEYTYTATEPEKDFPGCKFPDCLVQPLQNLAQSSLYSLKSKCAEDRQKASSDPKFLKNPFEQCMGRSKPTKCFLTPTCKTIDDQSICHSVQCTIPCEADGSCFNGKCENVAGVGNVCVDLSEDPDDRAEAMYKCVLAYVDEYLAVLLEETATNSGTGTPAQNFLELISEPGCFASVSGTRWPESIASSEEECNQSGGYCPWKMCLVGIECSYESCMNAMPTEEFCGFVAVEDFITLPVGRPNTCDIRLSDTKVYQIDYSEETCLAFGGLYVGNDEFGYRPFGACRTADATASDCYNFDGCISDYKGEDCVSYCVDPYSDAQNCTGGGEYPREYKTWIGAQSNTEQNACVMETEGLENCLLAGGQWVPGRIFRPELMNSPETCGTPLCHDFLTGTPIYNISEEECLSAYRCTSCYTGTEPSCFSEEACLSTNYCDNSLGCAFPRDINNNLPVDVPCDWNPNSCVLFTGTEACVPPLAIPGGYVFPGKFQSEEACLSDALICNEGTNPNPIISPIEIPKGYSYRNKEECEKCGGKIEPWWNWKQAEWAPANGLYITEWMKREPLFPVWKIAPTAEKMESVLETTRATRLASILTSEVLCQYGIETELLALTSCSCGEGEGSSKCSELTSLSGSPFFVLTACRTITSTTTIDGYEFIVEEDFKLDSKTPCIKAEISLVPENQFKSVTIEGTSSLALVSETEAAKLSKFYAYNDNDVVVGQIYGDGVGIAFDSDSSFSGIKVCLPIPNRTKEWTLHADMVAWDLAVASSSDYEFKVLKLRIPLDDPATQICVDLSNGDDGTYFVIGIIDNEEGATQLNSWPQNEKGLIIFCIIAYLIVFLYALANLISRMRDEKFLKKVPQAEIALVCIMVLSALGATYLLMVFTGYYSGSHLDPLLVDLPALCLLTCVCVIIVTWRGIVLDGLNVSLGNQSILHRLIPFFAIVPLYLVCSLLLFYFLCDSEFRTALFCDV